MLPVDLTFPYGRISKKKQLTSVIIWKRILFQSPEVFFSKFPPRTHTPVVVVVVVVSICKEYIWTKHSYFLTPTPKKRQRILWEIELFMKCESIESIFHFVQKQANNQPTTLTQGFSIHPNISRNLPRGESQLGWGWGARSWQWRFGLVCYWDSSLDSSTTKLRVPWQVGRAVLGGFLRWGF